MKEKRHLVVGAMVAEWEGKIARLKAELKGAKMQHDYTELRIKRRDHQLMTDEEIGLVMNIQLAKNKPVLVIIDDDVYPPGPWVATSVDNYNRRGTGK